MAITCTEQLAFVRNCFNPVNVGAMPPGSLLTSFLLVFSLILQGHPVLNEIAVVPFFPLVCCLLSLHSYMVYPVPDWNFFGTLS